MHYTKIVISERKKTVMETIINYTLINARETISFLIFPMTKFILKIARSTTCNLVEIMFYLSNNTFWVIVVPLVINEIKYTPLE